MIAAEQEHEIEIGGVGQRRAAQPPKPEDDEIAARDAAMRAMEFPLRGLSQHEDRRFGNARERGGDIERIAPARALLAFDQLDAQGEAPFADLAAHGIEQALVIIACLAAAKLGGEAFHAARQIEGAAIDQRIEQVRAAGEFISQRGGVGEHAHDEAEQRGAGFEQLEHVDRRWQPGEQAFPAQQRAVRIRRGGQRA